MYQVIIKPKAQKNLKRLHAKDTEKILKLLRSFKQNPFNNKFQVKKLKGFPNLEKAYRLRIGEIRVIYELDKLKKEITIYFIDYRRTTTYS